MSWQVKCPSSKLSQRRLSGVFITVSTVVTSLCRLCLLSLIGQTYLSLCNHHRHSLWGLVVSQSRCQKLFPCFISVVVYVDTATAWSNDSPVFFSVSHLLLFIYLFSFFSNGSSSSLYFLSSILSHLPFSPFLFCWFACFLTTASWNRSGWHPRSLTGQCTSHLPLPLLDDSHSLFLPPLRPSPLCFWLSFSTTCGFIAPSTLSHPDIYLYLPLHSLPLRHSPPTHFYFKHPSRLTWISSRGNSPSGLIDFLLCLSLLNARYRSNNRAEVCVKLASLNTAPSAISHQQARCRSRHVD